MLTAKVCVAQPLRPYHPSYYPSKIYLYAGPETPLYGNSNAVTETKAILRQNHPETYVKTFGNLRTATLRAATWDEDAHALAREAEVVSFGSPSAVRVWAERVGTSAVAACIGKTSADAATEAGFDRVVYPESPGVEAWADTVVGLSLW